MKSHTPGGYLYYTCIIPICGILAKVVIQAKICYTQHIPLCVLSCSVIAEGVSGEK